MDKPGSIKELDPDLALGNGRFDLKALLLLWCLRDAFFPVLWIGLTLAFIAMQPERIIERVGELDSAGSLFGALLSPLAGVALALIVRIAASLLALALAFPLSLRIAPAEYTHGSRLRGQTRLWWDRLYFARAYRSLRWTWAVRNRAAERLGGTGEKLVLCNRVLRVSNWPLAVIWVVAAMVVSR